jgi:hypothetical protein
MRTGEVIIVAFAGKWCGQKFFMEFSSSFILNTDLNMERLLKVFFAHIIYASYAFRKKRGIRNENVKEHIFGDRISLSDVLGYVCYFRANCFCYAVHKCG